MVEKLLICLVKLCHFLIVGGLVLGPVCIVLLWMISKKIAYFLSYFCLALFSVVLISQWVFHSCPLTIFENFLKAQTNLPQPKYDSFIIYYLKHWFGVETITSRHLSLALIISFFVVFVLTALLHWSYIKTRRRRNFRIFIGRQH